MTDLTTQLEAVLFYKGSSTLGELAKLLSTKKEDVAEALQMLQETLESRGIKIAQLDEKVELVTAPEHAELIENIRKEELSKDIGKAGAEVLSVILYKGTATRAEIDYIRGVNSSATLRNLLIRGLIKRSANPQDQRSYTYTATLDLLSFLGVTSVNELTEFETIKSQLDAIEEASMDDNKEDHE